MKEVNENAAENPEKQVMLKIKDTQDKSQSRSNNSLCDIANIYPIFA